MPIGPGLAATIVILVSCPGVSNTICAQTDVRPNFVFLISEDSSKHHFRLFDEHGTETPGIRRLANEGLVYRHAFSNSPVCSVARTTLMTGCYPTIIGSHNHRTRPTVKLPQGVSMFPALLRDSGYYTSNKVKTDYNVSGGSPPWSESSRKATWRNRSPGQPFFHMQTFTTSHEGQLHFPASDLTEKPIEGLDNVFVQPRHPDTPLFRYTRARYHQQIRKMDKQIGVVIDQLEADGLLESTYVFFFGDHGGVLPGTKGYVYETGLHVPLVVRIPGKFRGDQSFQPGSDVDQFVSFVDFGPTLLNLAGLDIPDFVSGRPFLGSDVDADEAGDVAFGFADRFDERIGMVRSVRKKNFKYIRNFMPWYVDGLQNNYRYRMAAFEQWRNLFEAGKLDESQGLFFRESPAEQLFDLDLDPYETNNLVGIESYNPQLKELRLLLDAQQKESNDLGLLPESFLRASTDGAWADLGKAQQKAFARWLQSFNMALLPMSEEFESTLTDNLVVSDDNPWDTWWVINGCLAGQKKTSFIRTRIERISREHPNRLVRTRAVEYLALLADQEPAEAILGILAEADSPFEATEILNAVVALRDCSKKFRIPVTRESVNAAVRDDKNVQRRLLYLTE